MIELHRTVEELTGQPMRELATLKDSGCQLAENEAEYRKMLRIAILEERDKGTPVTIISDICRGTPEIAKLRFERDCAEVVYKSTMEAINGYKLQCRF